MNDAECAVVVGGGLLGLEFVRAFLSRKMRVTLLVGENRAGFPDLDEDAGSIIERRLRELGVYIALEEGVASFESADGRVSAVRTSAGRTLECGTAGIAIGTRPRIDFLEGSAIDFDRGIPVNYRLRTTVPGTFVACDVAQAFDPTHGMARANTGWRTAREEGEIAGLNMAGALVRHNGTVGFNYKVFGGTSFVSIGCANSECGILIRAHREVPRCPARGV